MRIVQILASTKGVQAGGMEKHVVELASAQAKQHEVHLLAHSCFADDLPEDVHLHPLPVERSRNSPALLLALMRNLSNIRPDIVHAHGRKAGLLVNRMRFFNKAKRLITLHNLQKAPPSHMHGMIAVSHHIAEQFPAFQPRVIYNGIHLQPYIDQALTSKKAQEPVVIAIGRLVSLKGFDQLLMAWAKVRQGQLLIVGDGPMKSSLQKLAGNLGLDQQVRFLGHRQDIPHLLAQAHVCVIPSRREGFSYVFVEALATGVPVLATDVPVANEVLPACCIVPRNNPDELAERLQKFLSQPHHYHQQLNSVFQAVPALFSIESMVQKTLDYYEELLRLE